MSTAHSVSRTAQRLQSGSRLSAASGVLASGAPFMGLWPCASLQRASSTARVVYSTRRLQRASSTARVVYSAHRLQHASSTARVVYSVCVARLSWAFGVIPSVCSPWPFTLHHVSRSVNVAATPSRAAHTRRPLTQACRAQAPLCAIRPYVSRLRLESLQGRASNTAHTLAPPTRPLEVLAAQSGSSTPASSGCCVTGRAQSSQAAQSSSSRSTQGRGSRPLEGSSTPRISSTCGAAMISSTCGAAMISSRKKSHRMRTSAQRASHRIRTCAQRVLSVACTRRVQARTYHLAAPRRPAAPAVHL
jgi:hypothetical protein